MDEKLMGSLTFLGFGGLLSVLATLMAVRVNRFRQTAVRTAGTVVETWTQAIKARQLESVYKKGEPRRYRPVAPKVYAHRTRWVKIAYEDASGKRHEATRPVKGRYTEGQQVALLSAADDLANFQIDSPLEVYGKAAATGVIGIVFLTIGGLIAGNVVPLSTG